MLYHPVNYLATFFEIVHLVFFYLTFFDILDPLATYTHTLLTTIQGNTADFTEYLWIPSGTEVAFGCVTLGDCAGTPSVVCSVFLLIVLLPWLPAIIEFDKRYAKQ